MSALRLGRRMLLAGALVCLLAGGGCDPGPSREEAGVCYPEEHLYDHDNCACEGPCPGEMLCVYGWCEEQCGNGECQFGLGESCQTCPDDCGLCPPECGNGLVEEGEECDDGNLFSHDGCNFQCRFDAVCYDGVCDEEENCKVCPWDCGECPPECGNGELEKGEQCDDGNIVPGDGCSETCVAEPTCGDSQCHEDWGETCATCPEDCGEC